MARIHPDIELGRQMKAELDGDAEAISKDLFPSERPDSVKLTGSQFSEYFKRNWTTGETWRRAALKQYGAENFVKMAKDMVKPEVASESE